MTSKALVERMDKAAWADIVDASNEVWENLKLAPFTDPLNAAEYKREPSLPSERNVPVNRPKENPDVKD